MGLADYQKQKEIAAAAKRSAAAGATMNELLERLLLEQRRTNELLEALAGQRA